MTRIYEDVFFYVNVDPPSGHTRAEKRPCIYVTSKSVIHVWIF